MRTPSPAAPRSFRRQMVVLTTCITAVAMLLLTVVLQLILRRPQPGAAWTACWRTVPTPSATRWRPRRPATGSTSPTTGSTPASSCTTRPGAPVGGTPPLGWGCLRGPSATGRDAAPDRRRGPPARQALHHRPRDGGRGGGLRAPGALRGGRALRADRQPGHRVLATAAAAAIAAWVTSRALEPVAVLSRTAAEWSEHDLGRRFGLGAPTNEITALAATLDTLLDKVSRRDPLRAAAHLRARPRAAHPPHRRPGDGRPRAPRRGPVPRRARDDGGGRRRCAPHGHHHHDAPGGGQDRGGDAGCRVQLAGRRRRRGAPHGGARPGGPGGLGGRPAHRGTAGDPGPGPDPRRGERRALRPVAGRRLLPVPGGATGAASTAGFGDVRVAIEDDGPGIDEATDDVFAPGTTSSGGSGAGLGLAIARRMARSVGGELVLARPQGPTRFELRLPRA